MGVSEPQDGRVSRRALLAGLASMPFWPAAGHAGPPAFHGTVRQYVEFANPVKPPPAAFFGPGGVFCSLPKWRGRVVLFSFWATWCKPCIWEMPHLDSLQARLGGDDFQVVPVAMDDEGLGAHAKAEAFFRRVGIANLPLLYDHGREVFSGYSAINRVAMPMSYIVGSDGLLHGYMIGPANWDAPEAHDLIRHYIRMA